MLEPNDFTRLDERYITRKECSTTHEELSRKLENYSSRLAVIESQQKVTNWLLGVVGAGVLGVLIKLFVGGTP